MSYTYSPDVSTFIALSELQLAVLVELVSETQRRRDFQGEYETLKFLKKLETQLRTGLAAVQLMRAEGA